MVSNCWNGSSCLTLENEALRKTDRDQKYSIFNLDFAILKERAQELNTGSYYFHCE